MKTHTEIVWHYEGNPPEDGKYLVAYGMSEIYHITTDDYTVKYGWGTCPFLEMEKLKLRDSKRESNVQQKTI